MMAAGFERHIGRRTTRGGTCHFERANLGVGDAAFRRPARGEDAPVLNENAADSRILAGRTHGPAPEAQGVVHMVEVFHQGCNGMEKMGGVKITRLLLSLPPSAIRDNQPSLFSSPESSPKSSSKSLASLKFL
jgi:hypothetical protein